MHHRCNVAVLRTYFSVLRIWKELNSSDYDLPISLTGSWMNVLGLPENLHCFSNQPLDVSLFLMLKTRLWRHLTLTFILRPWPVFRVIDSVMVSVSKKSAVTMTPAGTGPRSHPVQVRTGKEIWQLCICWVVHTLRQYFSLCHNYTAGCSVSRQRGLLI